MGKTRVIDVTLEVPKTGSDRKRGIATESKHNARLWLQAEFGWEPMLTVVTTEKSLEEVFVFRCYPARGA